MMGEVENEAHLLFHIPQSLQKEELSQILGLLLLHLRSSTLCFLRDSFDAELGLGLFLV
jgi:hypothetical protein